MTLQDLVPSPGGAWRRPWRHPWVRHLRLGFNLTLSPLFLWGLWLAGGTLADPRAWVAFIALHVCLYGGTTAFNSFFDRDRGPIGGMRVPPPVDRGLLWWSLAVQAAGLPLALWVGGAFTAAYLVLFSVAAAYSHPAVRFKARPGPALAAVALGQGFVGFLAGRWAVAAPVSLSGLLSDLGSVTVLLGGLTAALTITGLYVVTQSFQTEEDAQRGDVTPCVALGPGRALRLGLAATLAGAALMAAMVLVRAGPGWSAMVLLGAAGLAVPWWRWAVRFDTADRDGNFRRAMAIALASGAALSALLIAMLLTQPATG